MGNKRYDLLILGAGPAGLTASIYASRYQLSNLVLGKILGGTMTLAHRVENYPGFKTISGIELGQKMGAQVKALGAEIILENAGRVEKAKSGFKVSAETGREFLAKTLVVATGTKRRQLGIPGEEKYLGRGVSYCTNCDLPFFRDKTVAIIGGADSACTGAIHAADFARKVFLVYRKKALRAEPVWVKEVEKNPKIKVVYDTNPVAILGDKTKVTGIKLDRPYLGKTQLPLDGVFVEIGGIPVSSLMEPLGVKVNKNGYIRVSPQMETSVRGVFAAGDVADRCGEFQQITVACSEGSLAAARAFVYLKKKTVPQITGDS